jgi:Rrf2 family transcriptional regulator, cysteine metabolism repressor
MQVSAKAEYACLALMELAVRYGDGKPVRLPEVADRHGIPQRFLVQILLQLKAAGLVASTRGAAGGYQLARDPSDITLADVLDVVDPPEPAAAGGRKPDVSPLAAALQDKWDEIAEARRKVLENTTVAELVSAGEGMQYVI